MTISPITSTGNNLITTHFRIKHLVLVRMLLAGLLLPLGFAPFHLPGLAILSIAFFYRELLKNPKNKAFLLGLVYGLGSFGMGISWVAISIHDYGQLNYFLSGLVTFLFVLYLAFFTATMALCFKYLLIENKKILSGLIFAALWVLSEYARANFMTGFPWLQLGISQIDTPLKYLAPIIGVYGLGFLTCFSATLLTTSMQVQGIKQRLCLIGFILIVIGPYVLKDKQWSTIDKTPITVGVIQANLSMRDKWDETLFWNLLAYYKAATQKLLGTQLIVMPESAIPLPSSYVTDYLSTMDADAREAGSAVLVGALNPNNTEETDYSNSVLALGNAEGKYAKQHLVPFGEYIPYAFKTITQWLGLPDPNILPGSKNQSLITIAGHPVASLICYEIAYQHLLRLQLPLAQWIVSNSDNGWFGHSLASYQQLQMAQMLSLETGRYQVVSNNDGLSSVINTHGEIVHGLPPFSAGILQSSLYPATGSTPWVMMGDKPGIVFCVLFLSFCVFLKRKKQVN